MIGDTHWKDLEKVAAHKNWSVGMRTVTHSSHFVGKIRESQFTF